MTNYIAVTQRVDIHHHYEERRDAIDQRWIHLLQTIGFRVLLLPNNEDSVRGLLSDFPIVGIIFTGGNDLDSDAPERDEVEYFLLKYAIEKKLPVLGVCRGMQLLQTYWKMPLEAIDGQVLHKQDIYINKKLETVNSFHRLGSYQVPDEFEMTAISREGVVKGIKHKDLPLTGIMWHPERISPYRKQDLKLIEEAFSQ